MEVHFIVSNKDMANILDKVHDGACGSSLILGECKRHVYK